MPIEIDDVATAYSGWGRYLVGTFRMKDGRTIKREIEDHGDAVAVLAYDPVRRKAMLVRQFRAPIFYATGQEDTLEVIAGGLDGDDPEVCVRREAMEEAGLRLGALEPVVAAMNMPGVSTARLHMYLATYGVGDIVHSGGGLKEEDEEITVVEMDLAELVNLIEGGGLVDIATTCLVQTLRIRHPELFVVIAGAESR